MSQDPASTTTSTFGGQTETPTNATFAFELDQRERLPGLYAGWFVARLSCDSNRQTFIARAHYDDGEIGEGEFGVFGRPSRDTKKTVRVLAKCVRMSDDTYELKIATSGFEGHMFKEKNTHASFKARLGEGESWRDDAPLPYWVRLPGNFELSQSGDIWSLVQLLVSVHADDIQGLGGTSARERRSSHERNDANGNRRKHHPQSLPFRA